MKKCVLIFLLLLGISCANENKAVQPNHDMLLKSAEIIEDELLIKTITLEQLTARKLKEYFELLQLQKQHHEFNDEIVAQLKKFTKGEALYSKNSFDFKITNIRQAGKVVKISDSISKLKLMYNLIEMNDIMVDSVYAIITTKTIQIDELEKISNAVTFKKIE